ncbi:MAG TPA: DUF4157 domain-containing protein, partial [Acidimicrobiales bacterium]|nr:DUF4157 domain-containing protein [Acidimicrobiales bacterium]
MSGSHQASKEEKGRAPEGPEGHGPSSHGTASRAGSTAASPAGPPGLLTLQRLAGNSAVARSVGKPTDRSPVLDVVGRGGRPLDPGVRAPMEHALDHDLSSVRVHTDATAGASALSVGARA